MDNNPYAPPSAELDAGFDETEGSFIPNGRTVGIGRASSWIGTGWQMFKQSAGAWIGLIVIWIVLIMIASLIPLVNIFNMLLGTLLTGGLMIACHNQRREGSLNVGDLFAGFSEHFVPLLLLGLLSMLLYFLAFIPMFITLGGAFFAMLAGGGSQIDPALIGIPFLLGMLVSLALLVPVMAALWFAPALVVISKCSPVEALKRSFFGCLRNWLPFLLWGLLVAVLFILSIFTLFLGLLVIVPMIWASTYAAFRDIYYAD
jgi:uncharacterized membrane protein